MTSLGVFRNRNLNRNLNPTNMETIRARIAFPGPASTSFF